MNVARPPLVPGRVPADPLERAAAAAAAGLAGPDPTTTRSLTSLALADPDPRVRAAALGALARGHDRAAARTAWRAAAGDRDP